MNATKRAAKMAGEWWTERLSDKYESKRKALSLAISDRVEKALNGVTRWDWSGRDAVGSGTPEKFVDVECDYEPQGLLACAVYEVFGKDIPNHKLFTSAQDLFPRKHLLRVSRESLKPKEGYGNYVDEILVKDAL